MIMVAVSKQWWTTGGSHGGGSLPALPWSDSEHLTK